MYEELTAKDRENIIFFVPIIDFELHENFLVELLDTLDGFLYPLKFGFWHDDIIDFVNSHSNDLMVFLQEKRYFCLLEDFRSLALKYNTTKMYKVICKNTESIIEDITNTFLRIQNMEFSLIPCNCIVSECTGECK